MPLLYLHRARGTDPYENLALESLLTRHAPTGAVILYLWQNRRTVVIGKNQDAWRECHLERLEADGGFLARRPSGGGAVFHDLGNLNFSFIARREAYSIPRQLEVIRQGVVRLGVDASATGRNDLTAGGRKFSGNAFLNTADGCCHHGTLLVDTDMAQMSRYLRVSAEKLQSKGVASVRARVVNLSELSAAVTMQALLEALPAAFAAVYGGPVLPLPAGLIDPGELAAHTADFAAPAWRLGRPMPFVWSLEHRFGWGELQLRVDAEDGVIRRAQAYSDAMDPDFIELLPACFTGVPFSGPAMAAALDGLVSHPAHGSKAADLAALLASQNL